MPEKYFVTAIGTDSGKTIVSAILTQMLKGDYWKPIQAGYPRDTDTVRHLVSNKTSVFHEEAYLLNTPASPHASAEIDGVDIKPDKIKLPVTDKDLVIEGAGGCLVPLNDEDVVIDLVPRFNARVILVSDLYLGSINHTLLTMEYLRKTGYPLMGIIFNGEQNAESQDIILQKTGLRCLLHIKKEDQIDKEMIVRYSDLLSKNWQ